MNNQIDKAVSLLKSGELVGMPTETVYGLAGCIDQSVALKKIFEVKERPFFDPLIVHVHSLEQAKEITTDWNLIAETLARSFWPGPLTLVLERNSKVDTLITSGLNTVGIRAPRHPVALELLKKINIPLAAPSANKFGKTSPTTAEHVRSEFRKENIFVLEGGPSEIGIESTVLSIQKKEDLYILSLLRKGFVSSEDIKNSLINVKARWEFSTTVTGVSSPGNMKHHYMPSIPLVLCKRLNLSKQELLSRINLCAQDLPEISEGIRLPLLKKPITDFIEVHLSIDPRLAAREFYAKLRELSQSETQCLLFYLREYHTGELWSALIDRIQKASLIHID